MLGRAGFPLFGPWFARMTPGEDVSGSGWSSRIATGAYGGGEIGIALFLQLTFAHSLFRV